MHLVESNPATRPLAEAMLGPAMAEGSPYRGFWLRHFDDPLQQNEEALRPARRRGLVLVSLRLQWMGGAR